MPFLLPPIWASPFLPLRHNGSGEKSDELVRVLKELTAVQRKIADLQVEPSGQKDLCPLLFHLHLFYFFFFSFSPFFLLCLLCLLGISGGGYGADSGGGARAKVEIAVVVGAGEMVRVKVSGEVGGEKKPTVAGGWGEGGDSSGDGEWGMVDGWSKGRWWLGLAATK
ncbi:hypothetical protein DM860_005997 [Cuscuta australis]|uniref:Uncharacterized protein n=1 Tax=Cuscuta australis TaxID=267555 RepID=A0A328DPC4_9ASTE|nr:hypothetical protein DM860_005997 [Cuscuta australis]